ncbi:MAG: DnaD domain protein [Peptococcaceae bacterium]|nr:DnaD domain protein [Peptococcaceae bacterium]
MSKQNITAWFFEGGSISIPSRLLGLMEPLGLTFEDLGKIMYLLYCGTTQIKNSDRYAVEAARTLHSKGLIHWFTDTETVDFSPMFDKISVSLGEQPGYMAEDTESYSTSELNYAQLVKKLEQTLAVFLTMRDKQNIQEAVQRYNWSYDLVYDIYVKYYRDHRKEYEFGFFCRMAYGAQVRDKKSFQAFVDGLNSTVYKTTEVLRKLGKKNSPSEPQKEMYLKWSASWKFTHEMILLAVDETTSADNPSFNYLDAVLKEWAEKGITTPEALAQEKQRLEKTKGKTTAAGKKQNPAVTQKFKPEGRDLSFLEK